MPHSAWPYSTTTRPLTSDNKWGNCCTWILIWKCLQRKSIMTKLKSLCSEHFTNPSSMLSYPSSLFDLTWRNNLRVALFLQVRREAGAAVDSGGPPAGCGVSGHQSQRSHRCLQLPRCPHPSLGPGVRKTDQVHGRRAR